MLAAVEAIRARDAAREEAANVRAGLIASVIVNMSPNRRKGAKPVRPTDFFRRPAKAQTPEEMAKMLDALAARQNAEAQS